MKTNRGGGRGRRPPTVRVTVPRNSGIRVAVESRTPSRDEDGGESGATAEPGGAGGGADVSGSTEPTHDTGGGGAGPSGNNDVAVDNPVIGDNEEAIVLNDDEPIEEIILEDDEAEAGDGDVEADAEHGGRPPQRGVVEPRQPQSNPNQQRWVRVRARLYTWILACRCGCRVCAARRQHK